MIRSICAFLFLGMVDNHLAWGKEFPLEEYDSQTARYISWLNNLSVEIQESDRSTDGATSYAGTHTFVSIPGYMRVKSVVTRQEAKQPPVVKTEWYLLRPDGYFHVTEKSPNQCLLKSWQKDIKTPLDVDSGSPIHYLTLPVCRAGVPLSGLLHGKSGDYHRVKPVLFTTNTSDPVYTLVTEDVAKNSQGETRYEFNNEWLIQSYSARSNSSKEGITFKYSYDMFGDKMLPSRVIANRIGSNGEIKLPGFETRFGPYHEFKGRKDDFSLEQFGIPETALYAGPGRWVTNNWLYFLASAVFFAGISVLFWRRARRNDNILAGKI